MTENQPPPPGFAPPPQFAPPPGFAPPPQSAPPPGFAPPPQSAPPPGFAPSPQFAPPPGFAPPPQSAPSPGFAPPPQSTPLPGFAPPPQSAPPPGFAPPPRSAPPPGFAPPPQSAYTPEYADEQTESLDPPPAAPNVIVEPQQKVITTTRGQDHVPDRWAISLISIFFCPIFGFIASFMANRANRLKDQPGDLEQAKKDAATAEKLVIVALIVGSFLIIIVAILTFVVVAVSFDNIYLLLRGPLLQKFFSFGGFYGSFQNDSMPNVNVTFDELLPEL